MAARQGDTVRVHYTGRLSSGKVFDSSREREPLAFTIGAGQIIPGFEKAVEGLEPGQKTNVTIPAEEAYGPHLPEAVVRVERDQLPPGLDPQVGQQLQVQQDNGHTMIVRVAEVDEVSITLDANHPLAGEDLLFEIELVAVE